MKRFVI